MTRAAFEERLRVNTAIGGSTNAPPHIAAIARHAGVELEIKDWERIGYDLPLLANIQPAGNICARASSALAVFRPSWANCWSRIA